MATLFPDFNDFLSGLRELPAIFGCFATPGNELTVFLVFMPNRPLLACRSILNA